MCRHRVNAVLDKHQSLSFSMVYICKLNCSCLRKFSSDILLEIDLNSLKVSVLTRLFLIRLATSLFRHLGVSYCTKESLKVCDRINVRDSLKTFGNFGSLIWQEKCTRIRKIWFIVDKPTLSLKNPIDWSGN